VVVPGAEADDGVALYGPIWAERGLDRGWGFGGGAGAEGGTRAHTHLCPYTPLPIHLHSYTQRVSESVGITGTARQSTAPSVSESV
jgi:hypothetical protein